MADKYIIITCDIHIIGGTQAYTAGKAKYLKNQNWNVYVLFPGRKDGYCDISYLAQFLSGGIDGLKYLPYRIDGKKVNETLREMKDVVGCSKGNIIIESHYEIASFWGELLAEKMNGTHYIFPCNEYYRSKDSLYESNLDFYKFKYDRNELIAPGQVICKIFNGYKSILKARIDYPLMVVEQEPIDDIEDDNIMKIVKNDFNICSIGRLEKPYVKYALEGIKRFAEIYSDKNINLIIIGNADASEISIVNLFKDLRNVNIMFLGVLVPIPRKLFAKVDVVIATAQTAQFVSYENVYTITANVNSRYTPGVLGYDTQDAWYGDVRQKKTYCEVLVDVLIRKRYEKIDFNMPEHKTAEYYYNEQWKYLALSKNSKEYYTRTFKKYRPKSWIALFPFWEVRKNEQILLYGAGEIGRDYIKQIQITNYCTISAVVDRNADDYDSSVLSPEEGLLNCVYDSIVIAARSQRSADEIKRGILEKGIRHRIVHDIILLQK